MHESKNTGYLHELLPIIAVILILLPILACAVHRARETSEQQTCTENLKRLGVACEMYQADWNDVLVPYGAPFAWYPNGMWPALLDTYIRKIPGTLSGSNLTPEYQCPSRPDTTAWAYERTYGMNMNCGGWISSIGTKVVVPLKTVRYPQATIRIAETWFGLQGGSWFAAKPVEYVPGDPNCHLFPEWHNGKGNVLWIDGHVSAMTQAQYNVMDTQADPNIWLRLTGPKPAVPTN